MNFDTINSFLKRIKPFRQNNSTIYFCHSIFIVQFSMATVWRILQIQSAIVVGSELIFCNIVKICVLVKFKKDMVVLIFSVFFSAQ